MSRVTAPRETTYQAPKWASMAQVEFMERILTRNEFYSGDYDRLWKLLEVHRIDVREPGDGSRMRLETASQTIEWLLRREAEKRAVEQTAKPAPVSTPNRSKYPDVPAGGYAVPSATGNSDVDFYRVDRPAEGKWSGFVFVKRVLGGHEDIRVRGSEARSALERITEHGILKSGQLFGQLLGECGACGTHLTDEVSRQRGYGPHCWKKVNSGE